MDSCYKMSAFVDFYVIVLLIIGTSDCCKDCEVSGWTSWSSCSTTGEQSIKSEICCPNQVNSSSAVEECIRLCNLTQEQIEVKRNCTYTSSAYLVTSTKIVSISNLVNEQSLTGGPSPEGNLLVSTRDATKRPNLQRLTGGKLLQYTGIPFLIFNPKIFNPKIAAIVFLSKAIMYLVLT